MTMKLLRCTVLCFLCCAQCQSAGRSEGLAVHTWPYLVPSSLKEKVVNGVTTIFGNEDAFAALKAGGEVVTWGNDVYGGDSSKVESKLSSNVTTIFSNADAFAALKTGGEVVTWGNDAHGGDSSKVESKLSSNVTTVFSNDFAFAALKTGGEVVTWGNEWFGGDSLKVESKLSSNVTTIFSNDFAFAALKTGGEVVIWGSSNKYAQFGAHSYDGHGTDVDDAYYDYDGDFGDGDGEGDGDGDGDDDDLYGGDPSKTESKLSSNVITIFSTANAFAALKAGGEVVTWGDGEGGGDSSKVESKLSRDVTTIFSNAKAFAALKAGGEVVTWGDEWSGGDSSKVESKLSRDVTTIFSKANAFAALKAGGEVVTWGDDWFGGDSSKVESKLSSNVTTIFSNSDAFAALKTGGEVVTWGLDMYGGDSSKVESKLSRNVTTIFSNAFAFAALKTGGEVVTWGNELYGADSSKVESKLIRNVTNIFSSRCAFAALKAGGEVVTWGNKGCSGNSYQPDLALTSGRVKSVISFGGPSFAALICVPHVSTGNPSVDCDPCLPDQVWAELDLVCQQCNQCAGNIVPNANQTGCETCKMGFAPNGSHCNPCVGNSVAPEGSKECQGCPMGQVPLASRDFCHPCDPDQIAEDGICKSCQIFAKPNQQQMECIPDLVGIVLRTLYILLISMFVKSVLAISSRGVRVIDVSLKRGQAILTTMADHYLSCPPCRPTFPITIHDTGHPGLDAKNGFKSKAARAKVVDNRSLELLDVNGDSINDRLDTSKGILRLTYADAIVHVFFLGIPVSVLAIIILLIILVFASLNFEAVEASVMGLSALLGSFLFCKFVQRYKLSKRTPLQRKLDEFATWISSCNPKPSACPKGPARAVRLDKLLETHHAFRSFIMDRTAYYLDANILKQLTAKHRLSYAELLGPEKVDFFVSHFWGTEFRHFCSSLQKHAETVWKMANASTQSSSFAKHASLEMVSGQNAQMYHVAYWICFCSNNQYDVANELGGDDGWQQSSFYLALQSPTCQSTCMILDDKALPLTRSWCIFETLQTLKLTSTRPGFEFLLCTESGVLNFGNGSIEAALGVVRGVARMDLQDAQASNKEDKDMIDSLVLEEMGNFDKMNDFVSDEIHKILQKAQETCSSEFQNLFNVLELSRRSRQKSEESNIPHSSLQAVGENSCQPMRLSL